MPKQKLNASVILKGRHTLTMKYSHKKPCKPYMKANDLEFVAFTFCCFDSTVYQNNYKFQRKTT